MELITIHEIKEYSIRLAKQNRPIEAGDLTIINVNAYHGANCFAAIKVNGLAEINQSSSYGRRPDDIDWTAGRINITVPYLKPIKNGPGLSERAGEAANVAIGLAAGQKPPAPVAGTKIEAEAIAEATKQMGRALTSFNDPATRWAESIFSNASQHATEQGTLKATIETEIAILNAQKAKIKALRDSLHTRSIVEVAEYMKAQPFGHLFDIEALSKLPRKSDGFFTI